MHRVTAVILAVLFLAILGLVAWGVVDGQAAAKPWADCRGKTEKLTPKARIEACSQIIDSGRTGGGTLGEAYDARAGVHYDQKSYLAAIADYDRALGLEPKDPYMLNQTCWTRAVAGVELDIALQRCTQAINLVGESGPHYAAMDSRGLVNLKMGRFEAALKDYGDALNGDSENPHYLFGRAVAESRLGDTVGASADYAAALERDKKVAEKYAGYGVTFQ